jgi:hypothetical protein
VAEFRAPLRATPGYCVVGVDMGQVIRRCAKSIHDRAEEGERRLREQEGRWKYAERESLTFLVEKMARGRGHVYRATSVTEVGGEGHGQVWAEARTIAGLEPELRYVLGRHYHVRRLCRDYDEARERANRVEFYLDRSFALGSKGEIE